MLNKKCLYCGNTEKEEHIHFRCPICGNGMCTNCYSDWKGTSEQCHDIADGIEDEELYLALKVRAKDLTGLICYQCVEKTQTELQKLKEK